MNEADTAIPEAVRVSGRGPSWTWLLPIGALLLSGFLVSRAWVSRGLKIGIELDNGHGIEAGDELRYRGIAVGKVEHVALQGDLQRVRAEVRLSAAAGNLARAGSRYWVVRPQLDLSGVSGLETLVGARYLAVLPGPESGPSQDEFVALARPPVAAGLEPGGQEYVLEAPDRMGLAAGAPLTYRGIVVGRLLSVELASDATGVEFRAYVAPTYSGLVRANSVFWEQGGIEAELSITGGLELEIGSLPSLLVGSVALGTPTEAGEAAPMGRRFVLHSEPQEEWAAWRPALAVGSGALAESGPAPGQERAQLSWRYGGIGGLLERSAERSGWVLRLEDSLLAPRDLLAAPEEANEGSVSLALSGVALAGFELSLPQGSDDAGGPAQQLVRVPLGVEALAEAESLESMPAWPLERTRRPEAPEDCLVFGDSASAPRALNRVHLESLDTGGWLVGEALGFDERWHGAAVLARSDARLIGLLLVQEDGVQLALLPQ